MPDVYFQCSIHLGEQLYIHCLLGIFGWHFKSNSIRFVNAHLSKIDSVSEIVPSRMCSIGLRNNILYLTKKSGTL